MRDSLHRGRPGRLVPFLLVISVAGCLALAFTVLSPPSSDAGPGDGLPAAGQGPASSALPDPVEPAFVPGTPRPLGSTRDVAYFAPVRQPTTARAEPSGAAAPVAGLTTRTPEGTGNIVLVLDRAADAEGRLGTAPRAGGIRDGSDASRRRPSAADGHALQKRPAGLPGRCGRRAAGVADADG